MTAPEVHKSRYRQLANSGQLQRQLAEEGFSVFQWQDSPGSSYGSHSHPHDEYIVIDCGRITFKVGGQSIELEAGDALVLPANTEHTAINEGDRLVRYFICTGLAAATTRTK